MALTGAAKLGKNLKLYVDVDGDIASPEWVEATIAQGVTCNLERATADVLERGVDFTLGLVGHAGVPVEVTLTRRPGNAVYDAFQEAAWGGTKIGLAVMTGTITDADERGLQGEFYVTTHGDDQGHESTSCTFTCRLAADYTTAPAYVTVVGV